MILTPNMAGCFPLLDFFRNLFSEDKILAPSAFVYDKSWHEDDDEELSAMTSSTSSLESLAVDRFDIMNFSKTHYPEFGVLADDDDDYDDDDYDEDEDEDEYYETDEADEEEEEQDELLEQTKEGQDIAVFLKVVDQLPLKSMLHLLKGHVRSHNLCIEQYSSIAEDAHKRQSRRISNSMPLLQKPQKHFRWAEVTGNQVRTVVHQVESFKSHSDLWWNASERNIIKVELIHTLRLFRKHHRSYIESLEAMLKAQLRESVLEDHIKELASHSYIIRGLEGNLSKKIGQIRKKHVRRVLNAQVACRIRDESYEDTCEILKDHGMETSSKLGAYARRLGIYIDSKTGDMYGKMKIQHEILQCI